MIKKKLSKTWGIIKKIFGVVFILHTGWFLVFLIRKFSVVDFAIANLKIKVLLVCGGMLAAGLVYYFWLRHYRMINKLAVIIREFFFIAYISSFIYLLLGLVFNPLITVTQAVILLQ
jgi:hypothetical protein